MKIKKLEIVGFKSFVDPTTLVFNHDITGIVGPNGCGKSNVVDAIRWVMGEQSPQRLRGKAMEDVIFSGSEARGPASIAEVTITFDNADGIAPPEFAAYSEIAVSRRLDRTGASDYFINRTPVRLLDVTNLFLGTGVGRRAYSIIEQGKIGLLVSSKPEDRRNMIDEAAGVTKFKTRKRAAERKIDQTRQNLLRVTDILSELERDLGSLKRQAQKAARYKMYRGELRDLELYVASHKYLELFQLHRGAEQGYVSAQAEAESARTVFATQEVKAEAIRTDLQRLGRQVEEEQRKAYEVDNQVRQAQAQIEQYRTRIAALQERDTSFGRDLVELSDQKTATTQELARIESELGVHAQDEAAAEQVLAELDAELLHLKQAATDAEATAQSGRARQSDARARLARAEAVLQSFASRRGDVQHELERLGVERASLGERLSLLNDKKKAVAKDHERVRDEKAGCLDDIARCEQRLEDLERERTLSEQNIPSLRKELEERTSVLAVCRQVRDGVLSAKAGMELMQMQASALFNSGEAQRDLVQWFGLWLDAGENYEVSLENVLEYTSRRLVIEEERSKLRDRVHQHELQLATLDGQLNGFANEMMMVERRQSSIQVDQGRFESLVRQTDDEQAASVREIADAQAAEKASSEQLIVAEEESTRRRMAVEVQAARVSDARVRATQTKERADRDRANQLRLQQSLEQVIARTQRIMQDRTDAELEVSSLQTQIVQTEEKRGAFVTQAVERENALRDARGSYEQVSNQVGQVEADLRAARLVVDEITDRLHHLELQSREQSIALQHLIEQVEERHRVNLLEEISSYHSKPVPDKTTELRIEELRGLLERMGEVNLTATEEFEEKSTRFEYLSAQRADLENALGQLERAIKQMNTESRALFRDAFAGINERFKRIFPMLFRGGKAELTLTENNDLLEAGVEIHAQPPGKKLGSLELMSGGEKALTAVALLLSIFQYKPSPFCLLDEVDAPLDEANIGRFIEAIQQMTEHSQFIVITHSKSTMERTDVLYGVTMEEPGISKLVAVELTDNKRRSAAA